jgi:hypothetical protein
MTVRVNVGKKTAWDQRNGMLMDTVGRGKSMGGVKNILVSGEYRLEVRMHKGCLNNLNRMELGNNSRMTFFEKLFHSVGVDELR